MGDMPQEERAFHPLSDSVPATFKVQARRQAKPSAREPVIPNGKKTSTRIGFQSTGRADCYAPGWDVHRKLVVTPDPPSCSPSGDTKGMAPPLVELVNPSLVPLPNLPRKRRQPLQRLRHEVRPAVRTTMRPAALSPPQATTSGVRIVRWEPPGRTAALPRQHSFGARDPSCSRSHSQAAHTESGQAAPRKSTLPSSASLPALQPSLVYSHYPHGPKAAEVLAAERRAASDEPRPSSIAASVVARYRGLQQPAARARGSDDNSEEYQAMSIARAALAVKNVVPPIQRGDSNLPQSPLIQSPSTQSPPIPRGDGAAADASDQQGNGRDGHSPTASPAPTTLQTSGLGSTVETPHDNRQTVIRVAAVTPPAGYGRPTQSMWAVKRGGRQISMQQRLLEEARRLRAKASGRAGGRVNLSRLTQSLLLSRRVVTALRNERAFGVLDGLQLSMIAFGGHPLRIKRYGVLYRTGATASAFYMLLQGSVQIETEEGAPQVVSVAPRGEARVLGIEALSGLARGASVLALDHCELLAFPTGELHLSRTSLGSLAEGLFASTVKSALKATPIFQTLSRSQMDAVAPMFELRALCVQRAHASASLC